jgi:FixJ family two-component response regulator
MGSEGMAASPLISIVDDDESARQALLGLVRALGFVVAEFQSAADFLRSDDLLRTTCLIVDVQMPGMTGLELYRHLVASGTLIPTILITAYPDETTHARALMAGVRGYLTKPFKPDDLLDCIHAILASQQIGCRS